MRNNHENNSFLTGAILGSVLGAVGGLLLAPKSGKELREDLSDSYENISNKAGNLSRQIREKGERLSHPFSYEEPTNNAKTMVLGSVTGLALGAIAALLLAPQSGKQLRNALSDSYDTIREKSEEYINNLNEKGHEAAESIGDWKDTIVNVLDNVIHQNAHGKRHTDIAELASLGIKLWQQLHNRR